MLELTVLLRYNEEHHWEYKLLGRIQLDFDARAIVGDQSTDFFNYKYATRKEIICNLFTSNKTMKEIFDEIRKSGMEAVELNFYKNKDQDVVILIKD